MESDHTFSLLLLVLFLGGVLWAGLIKDCRGDAQRVGVESTDTTTTILLEITVSDKGMQLQLID